MSEACEHRAETDWAVSTPFAEVGDHCSRAGAPKASHQMTPESCLLDQPEVTPGRERFYIAAQKR